MHISHSYAMNVFLHVRHETLTERDPHHGTTAQQKRDKKRQVVN